MLNIIWVNSPKDSAKGDSRLADVIFRDSRINIVIDGCSVECCIFEHLLTEGFAKAYSYEFIVDFTRTLFETLLQFNIHIQCLFVDSMLDPDTLRLHCSRKRGRINRADRLKQWLGEAYLDGVAGNLVCGLPHLQICAASVRETILSMCEGSDHIYLACMHPDRFFPSALLIPREIAKYAHDHDCYVLTRDSHFYAYSIPGVIDVERVIKTLARNPDPSSIPVFCRHMLDTFGRALSHRSNSASSEYNIATYPAFPLSLLTKTKDDTLFALYETTRGEEQREE